MYAKGLYRGKIDGDIGPLSVAAMMKVASATPDESKPLIEPLARAIAGVARAYDLTLPLRLCHFLAQGCHETDEWKTLVEYGGPAYFKRYDGRADLGNTEPGDGYRFRGRGFLQFTGRANYKTFGELAEMDLIGDPDRAADPATSVLLAGAYWQQRRINNYADENDLKGVTRKVNGGTNGLQHRRGCLQRLGDVWGFKVS